MRLFVVVRLSPVLDDGYGLLDRSTQPALQAASAQDAMKALVLSVLPRTARLNAVSLDIMHVLLFGFSTAKIFCCVWSSPIRRRASSVGLDTLPHNVLDGN
jgi:hypothetical protein